MSDPVVSAMSMMLVGLACFVVVLVSVLAVASLLVRVALRRGVTKLSDLFCRRQLQRISVLSGGHGQHQTAFVSRHHLAEGGLMCPLCQTSIPSGDFTGVKEYIVDGHTNEGVVCQGEREVGDRMVACATILLASPDTEHGDHFNDDGTITAQGADPPAFYRFVRCSPLQSLREKWGVNVDDADMQANTVDLAEAGPTPTTTEEWAVFHAANEVRHNAECEAIVAAVAAGKTIQLRDRVSGNWYDAPPMSVAALCGRDTSSQNMRVKPDAPTAIGATAPFRADDISSGRLRGEDSAPASAEADTTILPAVKE